MITNLQAADLSDVLGIDWNLTWLFVVLCTLTKLNVMWEIARSIQDIIQILSPF